ncbi:hypothetical protein YYC_02095 [Plasmodium yoelii 17X]|uniref:YIR protein n=1 Tax=Plasmodium yoelii 17X TaxID=1323249 RepID=V7PP33_PLAYE|nr:hypothetical protein YYC_02095 [Plasmodium yoelii 17X]
MNKEACERFKNVWTNFKYDSSNGNYKINDDGDFKKYCNNGNCASDLERINAASLYLFNEFFGDSSSLKNYGKNNIDIVEYIIISFSYMLSLLKNNENDSLKFFYTTYISNDKYKKGITHVEGCGNYKDLIDNKQDLTTIDIKEISKFYEPFKLLCEMYTEFDEHKKDCATYSDKASQFATKFEELNKDSNITKNGLYRKILSILYTLSNDYDNFKNKCNDSSLFPTIDKTKITIKCPEQISEVTSSSSTANKLFIVLSIFGAIAIFLGISYKYSLFGFRKRAQKQYLREKIKNIKKKMNH